MITPRFECSQTPNTVVINIYCPSVRAADVEIHVDDTLFSLHLNPYFLRLTLPHPVLEDDDSSAKYDAGTGYLTVTLAKANPGQDFPDLDLLSKLLAPRPATQTQPPQIEVLGDDDGGEEVERHLDEVEDLTARTDALSLEREEILRAAENDWQLPQQVPSDDYPISMTLTHPYGFLSRYGGYFKHAQHTENEINELGGQAETLSLRERRSRRVQHENAKWDEEHYMADYADDEYIQELVHWVNPRTQNTESFEFSDQEKAALLNLPRREYLSDEAQTRNLYLSLTTILFAAAYEARTTQGDPTPESAWTICILTPIFSALDGPPYSTDPPSSDLIATLVQSYRRSLSFPLFRSFALAEKCRSDVAALFKQGKRAILRCLLETKHILEHHEVNYVYSKIWVEDFCVWVQSCADEATLQDLGRELQSSQISKALIGWDLEELESAALEVQEREPDSDDE
ncbi:unnamed protein product [Mycena citricolor]|uniref:CS domain-containing protein n=1 Tax=Mycena citricolor TaxID=2018698 RepID=A0AAD2GZ33_9AGAR|nr:unnamed protein product [Mycena citricolor]CAK5265039.1 unnamed protein product [Mycena citricolor]